MDGDEDYVGQLKDVFNECDHSGKGLINKSDLLLLCKKLQVEDHADALVERLIGTSEHKRVGFDEFKDGFVAVLSQCADLISTEDEFSAHSLYEEEGIELQNYFMYSFLTVDYKFHYAATTSRYEPNIRVTVIYSQ